MKPISTKCLKSDAALSITGGTFVLDSAEDGVHGVEVQLLSGSFPLQQQMTPSMRTRRSPLGRLQGKALPSTSAPCYEGLEGAQVYLNAGSVNLCATDDGINAAGMKAGGRLSD